MTILTGHADSIHVYEHDGSWHYTVVHANGMNVGTAESEDDAWDAATAALKLHGPRVR